MKTTTKPAAPRALPSTQYLAALLSLGALALDLWRAELAVKNARAAYLQKIESGIRLHGEIEGRLNPDNPAHAKVIKHSAEKYGRYQAARRTAYNIKRRMDTASRNAARHAAIYGSDE